MAKTPLDSEALTHRWNEILRISRNWRVQSDLQQLMLQIVRDTAEKLDLERGGIFLLGGAGLSLRAAWPAKQAAALQETSVRAVVERVIRDGRPVFVHPLTGAAAPRKHAYTAMVYCVPLVGNSGVLGALCFACDGARPALSRKDEELMELLAVQGGTALDHALLFHSAVTDPLTGLFSHRHFQLEVEQALRRAARMDEPLALLIMDLDHFKELNDTCGHDAGNKCLQQVAEALRQALRQSDVLARFGGDEFEVLLPNTPRGNALHVAEKIRASIEKLRSPSKTQITATLGLACCPENSREAQALFLHADDALYAAKEAGRNRVVCSNQSAAPVLQQGHRAAERRVLRDPAAGSPAAEKSQPISQIIDGHKVIKRLGVGTVGEVLLVTQPELRREIALKRPLTPHLTPAQEAAFVQEATLTASLAHPGVVTVLTMGRDTDSRRYFTMEPISGKTLEELLDAQTSAGHASPSRRLLEIVQRAAETIAYAHSRGVAHLDLTPGNIVVGEFSQVKVIDWGRSLSRRSSARTPRKGQTSGFVFGSLGDVAPEQLPGSAARPGMATDVHALGTILYRVLTGRRPYAGRNSLEVLAAIRRGAVIPPDEAVPKAAIDPLLSGLCLRALAKDPARRPSAVELAEQLGRYVRQEWEFVTIKFGKEHRQLRWRDWKTIHGKWRIQGEDWVTGSHRDYLIWRTPVTGAFRFRCECWNSGTGELALLGKYDIDPGSFDEGYAFKLGAEWNTCTRLGNFAGTRSIVPQPHRHYELELRYEEGWVYCYVDGKLIFEHRELFHPPGRHLAVCSYDPCVHFRPLEIRYQRWGLQAPAVHAADELYRCGNFAPALRIYSTIAENCPRRLEGLQARLKSGMCLTRLKRFASAMRVFRSLDNTALEPHARAQRASLELSEWKRGSAVRGVKLFEDLAARCPHHYALRAADAFAYRFPSEGRHDATAVRQLRCRINRVQREATREPTLVQVIAQACLMINQMELGQWKPALAEALRFRERMCPPHDTVHEFAALFALVALANGREDLLSGNVFREQFWTGQGHQWRHLYHSLAAQILLRKKQGVASLRKLRLAASPLVDNSAACDLLVVWLATGRRNEAERWLRNAAAAQVKDFAAYQVGEVLQDAGESTLLAEWLDRIAGHAQAARRSALLVRLRELFEGRLFDEGATLLTAALDRNEHERDYGCSQLLLFAAFASGLGLLERRHRPVLSGALQRLHGTELDLARVFLRRTEPTPSALWPHPLYMPKWRLWLALWLEVQGKGSQAARIVRPAQDRRFGPTHCQHALAQLMRRIRRK